MDPQYYLCFSPELASVYSKKCKNKTNKQKQTVRLSVICDAPVIKLHFPYHLNGNDMVWARYHSTDVSKLQYVTGVPYP